MKYNQSKYEVSYLKQQMEEIKTMGYVIVWQSKKAHKIQDYCNANGIRTDIIDKYDFWEVKVSGKYEL